MSTTAFRIASAAVLALLVGACTDAPTSPVRDATVAPSAPVFSTTATGVERWVDEELYDLTGSLVAYPCGEDGYTEQILMEGKVFQKYSVTWDASGGVHALIHSMPIGLRGIGQITGAEYRVAEREHGVFNQGTMGQTTSTYQSFLTFSSPELGVRGRLILGGRFVVNANGEVIFERPILRADCQE